LGQKNNLSKKISPTSLVKIAQEFLQINQQLKSGTFIDKKTKNSVKKVSGAEAKELDVCSTTCEAIQKKLQPLAVREQRGSSGNNITTVVASLVIIGAGGFYLMNNCCNLTWCRSVSIFSQLLKC